MATSSKATANAYNSKTDPEKKDKQRTSGLEFAIRRMDAIWAQEMLQTRNVARQPTQAKLHKQLKAASAFRLFGCRLLNLPSEYQMVSSHGGAGGGLAPRNAAISSLNLSAFSLISKGFSLVRPPPMASWHLPCKNPGFTPASSPASSSSYDRLSEVKAFDATMAGVKGLVDAGITAVPRIFHNPAPATEPELPFPSNDVPSGISVPVIDLAVERADLVAQVKAAAETVGFFQVINHGIPSELLAEMLASVCRFHEQPVESKAPYYTRDPARHVRYQSNFHLYTSPAANWRDTLFIVMTPSREEVPPPCRDVLPEYTEQVRGLGALLLQLLSEALGMHPGFLEHDAGCQDDGLSVAGHYYPPCPEPQLTMGTTRHSDPCFLTVLLQDDTGGLQVLLEDEGGGTSWVDVPPVPGALVVNIGDFLQLVTNDRFKSVEHRVRAMAAGRRVSVACFFRTADGSKVYGPIGKLLEVEDERPRYRCFTVPEFMGYHMGKGLDGPSSLEYFRL